MKPIFTGTLAALLAASLTGNLLMYLRYSTSRPLVTVGGQAISKKDYQDRLDYQTQGAVLKQMVLSALVTQAAARQGVTPTEADVSARLADIQRRDPQALAAADQDPAKMAAFRDGLKTDLALEGLRLQGVSVSPAEVAAFYDRHRDADPARNPLALPVQVRTTLAVTGNAVDAATAADLLRQGIALNVIAHQPRLHVVGVDGFSVNLGALPPALSRRLSAAAFGLKPGAVQTVPLGNQYVTLRAEQHSGAGIPPLAQIRPQVTRLAALEKAVPAPVEVAKLYQAAAPSFTVARYEDYFADLKGLDVGKAMRADKTASAR